jgi:hypothetical protein
MTVGEAGCERTGVEGAERGWSSSLMLDPRIECAITILSDSSEKIE